MLQFVDHILVKSLSIIILLLDQVDEDQEDADERWDADSDMEVDNSKQADETFQLVFYLFAI